MNERRFRRKRMGSGADPILRHFVFLSLRSDASFLSDRRFLTAGQSGWSAHPFSDRAMTSFSTQQGDISLASARGILPCRIMALKSSAM